MRGIKIPPQDLALKMHGGLMHEGGGGGAYLRDTTILVSAHGHPSATIAQLREAEVNEVMQHIIDQTFTLRLYLINRSITMYIMSSNTLQWCCIYLNVFVFG